MTKEEVLALVEALYASPGLEIDMRRHMRPREDAPHDADEWVASARLTLTISAEYVGPAAPMFRPDSEPDGRG